jgi:hypothetical protein
MFHLYQVLLTFYKIFYYLDKSSLLDAQLTSSVI